MNIEVDEASGRSKCIICGSVIKKDKYCLCIVERGFNFRRKRYLHIACLYKSIREQVNARRMRVLMKLDGG